MNNKLNNMLNDFLKKNENLTEEEMNQALNEFMKNYNMGNFEYENTPLDNAYEMLSKAENAKSEKEALKIAKATYEKYPECFDALLLQLELEENYLEKERLLEEGLKKEKERLKKENYFVKDNIGYFYGIFETRPYLSGMEHQALLFANSGKLKKSRDVCLEILRLNKNDNLGIRYLLMAIYAMLEEEKELLSLYKKYPEDSFSMLFPLFIYYYKIGNDKKAKEYLEKVNKANLNFSKIIKGKIKPNAKNISDYYSPGDISEVIMYFEVYAFLIFSVPTIHEFVFANDKKQKNLKK